MAPEQGRAQDGRESHSRPSTLILGVGNILMSDEGVGVRVIAAMQDHSLPRGVELLDGGTASLDLLNSLSDRGRVIVVDAVQGGCEPGTLYRFSPEDVAAQERYATSVHQIGLLETLTLARFLGCAPEQVIIYGVEPGNLGYGLELSSEIAAVVPRVIELVLGEVEA